MTDLQKFVTSLLPPGAVSNPFLLLIFVVVLIVFLWLCGQVIKFANKKFDRATKQGKDYMIFFMLLLVLVLAFTQK